VQGLPVKLDGFLGAGSQIVDRIPGNHIGREFWYVSAIVGAVPFNDRREYVRITYRAYLTSLRQISRIGPRSDVVAKT